MPGGYLELLFAEKCERYGHKPTEKWFRESFNGKMREECLNENWFTDLADARQPIEAWRVDYDTQRPHSALERVFSSC